MAKKAIGIDLGTTNSCAAYMEMGKPVVIKNKRGGRTIPSVVSFDESGVPSVGEVAKRQRFVNPDRTIISIKRKMGTTEKIKVNNRSYTPEEISGFILREIRGYVSEYLSEDVVDAVITVPAYFNDSQRAATKDAAQLAGLNALRIINEPTAAALAYKFDKAQTAENILVYDLGGGTFDVSVLSVDEGVFQVLATSGDNHLGGDDFDKHIYDWVVDEITSKTGVKNIEPIARERILEAAERAKCDLSSAEITNIQLPLIVPNFSLDLELSRAKFDYITSDLVERTKKPALDALTASKLEVKDITNVILVGGSTRIVSVKQLVRNLFNKEPVQDIDPDEVVAMGAAIEAGVKLGTVSDVVLVDVTPLSLGMETVGGVMDVLIERNSKIRVEKRITYTTVVDIQDAASIEIYQGERPMVADNHKLGEFKIELPAAPRGVPKIEVTFHIDENGILNVTAEDTQTKRPKTVKIQRPRMSDAEKRKAIEEAEQMAEKDRIKSSLVTARLEVESTGYAIDKKKKEEGLSAEAKEKLENLSKRCADLLASVPKPEDASESDVKDFCDNLEEIKKDLASI